MSDQIGTGSEVVPGSAATAPPRHINRPVIGYAYYNHRLVGPVKSVRAALRHFAKWEDLIDLMDLRQFEGIELDLTYSIHSEGDLGHLGPSEFFDAFAGEAG